MTLGCNEFIRRFLLHVLPKGFHRIRHYGLLASGTKADNLARMRKLLEVEPPAPTEAEQPHSVDSADTLPTPCPCCGARMHIVERFEAGAQPRHRALTAAVAIRIDTS